MGGGRVEGGRALDVEGKGGVEGGVGGGGVAERENTATRLFSSHTRLLSHTRISPQQGHRK